MLLILPLGVLTLTPVASVLVGSLRPDGMPASSGWTLSHYADVWGAGYSWRLLGTTLVFASGSAVLAILLGLLLAWLIERTDLPWRGAARVAVLTPMAVPPLLLAIGWALVLAPRIGLLSGLPGLSRFSFYSLGGAIFVQALAYVPTCVLMLGPAIRNMDPSFEEAARVARGSAWRVMRRVSLPFLAPALQSLATLLMIVGMLAFDVPAVIAMPGGVDLMSIEVFRDLTPPSGLPDYGAAAALNAALFVLLAGGLVLYRRTTREAARFATIAGRGYRPTLLRLGRWRAPAAALVAAYFTLTVALPFLALLWASLMPYLAGFSSDLLHRASVRAYTELFATQRVWEAAGNSALVAATASLALMVLSLGIAWISVRRRGPIAWLADALAMVPLGVPPLMMGVALLFVAFSLRFLSLYGTIWIIALGHLIAFLPVCARMLQSALLQVGRELEEASATAGAGAARTLLRVLTPLLRPALLAMVIWAAVHSVREFSIAVMLQSGRNSVLSTALFSYWETGKPERAAAMAVLLMLVLGALTGASVLTGQRVRQ